MNKQDLIKRIAHSTGETQKDTKTFVDAFIESVIEGLEEDHKVQLAGFLTLEVKEAAERNGFNPHTQEPMVIPAGYRVSARVSDVVKNRIKDLY